MQSKRILVVEDDRNIALSLETLLLREGCKVRVARDAAMGMSLAASFQPDLILLDWMLPDGDGLSILKSIRSRAPTPILFVTARDDVTEKVLALEMGADDYLTKPFHNRELVARMRSLLRRTHPGTSGAKFLAYGPIEIQVDERRAARDGVALDLTRIEFDLLLHFVRNPRVVLSREVLLEAVWGYDFDGYQRTVDTHVRRLRVKVEPQPDTPQFIHSVRGIGYRFEYDPARS
ncbi:MAG: response regulator transcription factor [Candidatus Wallbacteria bacterium]|nr:response regulator transcription factor [Candidatus Wallbacteria bacterium]